MADSSVTSENAPSLAGQAYNSINGVTDQSELSFELLLGVSVSQFPSNPLKGPLTLLYKRSAIPSMATGATYNCTNGGSVTYNESSNALSVDAHNCREDVLVDGKVSIKLSNVVGEPSDIGNWSADIAIIYTDLTVVDGELGMRITGDMDVAYDQTSMDNFSASSSGDSLHMRYLESGSVVLNTLLKPYDFTFGQNGVTSTSGADFIYASSGSSLGDISYTLETHVPFESTGANYPHAGSFTVTATDGSTVTLTALDNTNVQLDLDLDGDSTVDETINTTWVALGDAV